MFSGNFVDGFGGIVGHTFGGNSMGILYETILPSSLIGRCVSTQQVRTSASFLTAAFCNKCDMFLHSRNKRQAVVCRNFDSSRTKGANAQNCIGDLRYFKNDQ